MIISVQGFRKLRTASTETLISYRDVAKLPTPENSRFKRMYLKGASNRVKSMKEEKQFAELWSERRSKEKEYKFTREDQLVKIRNLHLKKIGEVTPQSTKSQQKKSLCQSSIQSQIQVNQDQMHNILEINYNATPVVTKLKNSNLVPKENNKEMCRTFHLPTKFKTEQIPQHKGSICSQHSELANTMQTTSYGNFKIKTTQSKTPTQPKMIHIPSSLEKTKQQLQQFL